MAEWERKRSEYEVLGLDADHKVREILDTARSCLKELNSALSGLPSLDERGQTDTPYAEVSYKRKKDAHASALSQHKVLRECMAAISIELQRNRENLAKLEKGGVGFHTPTPHLSISAAIDDAAFHYKNVQRQREEFERLRNLLGEALRESSKRPYLRNKETPEDHASGVRRDGSSGESSEEDEFSDHDSVSDFDDTPAVLPGFPPLGGGGAGAAAPAPSVPIPLPPPLPPVARPSPAMPPPPGDGGLRLPAIIPPMPPGYNH